MAQDVGRGRSGTIRELLLSVAPARVREAGLALLRAEASCAATTRRRALGEAIGAWSDLGGYELEGQWDAACRRIVRAGLDDVGDRARRPRSPAASASGSCSTCCSRSDAQVLLLDEPDNFLDVPAKRALEEQIRATQEDRPADLPRPRAADRRLRHDRHAGGRRRLGPRRLLRDLPRGPRAPPEADGRPARALAARRRSACASSCGSSRSAPSTRPDWAKRAKAMESRWKRFIADGPPPAPVADQHIKVRLRGGDSARRVLDLRDGRHRRPRRRRSPRRSTSASASASSAPTARARRT